MFWQKYLELCNSVGKAPNVVAAEIGVKSSGTVTGWKNGALPRSTVLDKLSKYFDIDVSELTGETQKKEPTPVSESGSPYPPEYDLLSPEDKELVDNMIRSLAKKK